MADSIIADRARAVKASALVEQLHQGATAATIPFLNDAAWTQAAQAAGVRAPLPATRALVARWFTEREQPASDPVAGLDDVPEAAL